MPKNSSETMFIYKERTNMNKHIFNYLTLGITALLAVACNQSEGELLEPKVYFENKEYRVTMEEGETMELDITSRLSNMTSSQVNVSYSLADAKVVDEYNAKYGTNYLPFDAANAKLSQSEAVIEQGDIYAGKVKLALSNLKGLEEGKSYVLPIQVRSQSVPAISGGDIEYVILAKPIRITNVGEFDDHFISVKFPPNTFFKSFTYEALVYFNRFNYQSNTILGTEGVMILRVGDTGGGVAANILQAAGRQHYEAPDKLDTKKWYHLALTYDQSSGKTMMYVNGNKVAESGWNIKGFNPNEDVGFNIGKLPNFPWGQRQFYGYMSEVRVWSVARSENQIKQNMLGVDPKSDGLELYYKLNGTETEDGGVIKDAAKGLNGNTNGIQIHKLSAPVSIE